MNGATDWLVRSEVDRGSDDGRRRVRLFVAQCCTIALCGIPYAAFFNHAGAYVASAACAAGIALVPGILLLLRHTGRWELAGNIAGADLFLVLTIAALFTGGMHAPSLLWYAAVPIVAASVAGRRSGLVWTAATLLSLAAFAAAEYGGYAFRDDLSATEHRWIGAAALFGVVVVVAAVTHLFERFQRETTEELSCERAKLQAIFDAVQEGLLLVDGQTRLIRVNDVIARLVGKDGSVLCNCQPGDALCCIHAREAPEGCGQAVACRECVVRKTVGRVIEEGIAIRDAEATLRLAIGGELKQLCVVLSATPLEIEGKKHVLLALADVSRRKQAEERYRALFESSRDAIMTLAPPSWRFTSCNPTTVTLFGTRDETEFTSLGPWDLSPQTQPDGRASAEKAKEMIETAMRQGSHFFEWTHKRLNAGAFPATVLLARVEVGCQAFLQATVRDITPQKQAELQREQYATALEGQKVAMEELYKAAEAATRAKSEFLANMSHEIRTPMSAILGYAELVGESIDCCTICPGHATCQTPAQNRTHMAAIRRNGAHLLEIINDILNLSKIEAGKLQMEWRACSPVAILADVVSLMRARAEAKGLSLKLEFAGPMPETILTDSTRLRQILLNLIGNAIKFTETGGVRVVARVTGRYTPRPKLVCEIIDTGIGMTAEQVQNLFQPFSQGDASTSRKFGGTGLGLAISQRLAGLLRGDIAVASQPGQGSTFVLTVDSGPLADVAFQENPSEAIATAAAPLDAGKPAPRLNCRILLAEDGGDNRRLIALLLRKAGADVTAVENGLEAIESALAAVSNGGGREDASRGAFDLILMDMQMPVMDGYEATRRLRAEGYTGLIVALTAHAMTDDRQKCLEAGCDDYMAKPVERVKLLATIDAILKNNGARPDIQPAGVPRLAIGLEDSV